MKTYPEVTQSGSSREHMGQMGTEDKGQGKTPLGERGLPAKGPQTTGSITARTWKYKDVQ